MSNSPARFRNWDHQDFVELFDMQAAHIRELEKLYNLDRFSAFSRAMMVARKCSCKYCKTVVTILADAMAEHGDLA